MTHDFPSTAEVVAIHDVLIHETGGSTGLRDMGAQASAIMRPQIGYYNSLIEEAAAMLGHRGLHPICPCAGAGEPRWKRRRAPKSYGLG